MSYNGYKNYETWAVSLWLDNEEGLQNITNELANNPSHTDYALADHLKEMVQDMAPDLGASMFADLLNAALDNVDWLEIIHAHKEEPATAS